MKKPGTLLLRIAALIFVVIAIANIAAVNTKLTTISDGSPAAASAITKFNSQTLLDTNIYQQQVSALWATKDLLKVVADLSAGIRASNELIISLQMSILWILIALLLALVSLGNLGLSAYTEKNKLDEPKVFSEKTYEALSIQELQVLRAENKISAKEFERLRMEKLGR